MIFKRIGRYIINRSNIHALYYIMKKEPLVKNTTTVKLTGGSFMTRKLKAKNCATYAKNSTCTRYITIIVRKYKKKDNYLFILL
ncbi:MAG: hypothetical protein H6Q59_1902 [Firmicutes bacterium]|nr:hypothetical protein [Bacillota bacterium]